MEPSKPNSNGVPASPPAPPVSVLDAIDDLARERNKVVSSITENGSQLAETEAKIKELEKFRTTLMGKHVKLDEHKEELARRAKTAYERLAVLIKNM